MNDTNQAVGIENSSEKEQIRMQSKKEKQLNDWVPKTLLGKKIKEGQIGSLEQVFLAGDKFWEPEIVDFLLSDLEEKLIEFRKTTRVTRSGRVFSYRAAVLVGDKQKFVGLGTGKDKERYPAVRKATKNAKLALIKVQKSCGSWECGCSENHSVPFKVNGKSSSVRVIFFPAPKGTGLVVGDNIKDVLRFVGIKDVWCKTFGNTASKLDFVKAAINALEKTSQMRYSKDFSAKLGGEH